jgi:hypothetical protein
MIYKRNLIKPRSGCSYENINIFSGGPPILKHRYIPAVLKGQSVTLVLKSITFYPEWLTVIDR